MSTGKLSSLQLRILETLATIEPRWTLTGGGALGGFHLGHRSTRDLDLFFRGLTQLGGVGTKVISQLTTAGLSVAVVQHEPAFQRLKVDQADASTIVDLVAEPVPSLMPPEPVTVGGANIGIDSLHELLVNKLCALLSRSEVRDLVDVDAILRAGGDLSKAIADAPKKDGGFSPLTLAWVLSQLPIEALARSEGMGPAEAAQLDAFRNQLTASLTGTVRPK